MPFTKYYAKNNSQGVVLLDTSSQITFETGNSLPQDISDGQYLITLGGPGGEIVKVTDANVDGSGNLIVDVERSYENSFYSDASSGTIGYLYLTAGIINNLTDSLEDVYDNKISKPDSSAERSIPIFDTISGGSVIASDLVLDTDNALSGVNELYVSSYIKVGNNTHDDSSTLEIENDGNENKQIRFTTNNTIAWALQSDTGDDFYITGDTSGNALKITQNTNDIHIYGKLNGRNITADGDKLDLIDVTSSLDLNALYDQVQDISGGGGGGTGDLTGPSSATLNTLAIFDNTSGKSIAASALTYDGTSFSGSVEIEALDSITIGRDDQDSAKKLIFQTTTGTGTKSIDFYVDSSKDWSLIQYNSNRALKLIDNVDSPVIDIPYLGTDIQIYRTINGRDIEADGDKLDLIDVTSSLNLNTMYSDIQTNNAKVTNSNHTGDATGSTALTIVPSFISGKTGVTPVSGDYLLLWDATDSALKKVDASNFLSASGGDVTGAASSTDLAIAIFNGTGGKTIKNTGVLIDASNNITGVGTLAASGTSQIGTSSTNAARYLDLITDTANRKGVRFYRGTNAKWVIQSDTDHSFKILRYDTTSGVFAAYDMIIDSSTGNITTSGTVNGRTMSTDGTKLDGIAAGAQVNTVTSVNTLTGAITLVTGNISDSTSTQKYTTAANLTKLGFITVTQAVDLDTMESNIATNNAKVTNATHTGDVTGATALTIVPSAISGKTAVTPVAGDYVLLWDATDSLIKKADVTTFVNGSYGDVTGPASATDSGIAIYNGVGGKTIKSSLVTIDTSSLTIPGFLTVTGQARQSAQTALSTTGSVTWNINNDPCAKIVSMTGAVTLTISGINLNSVATLYVKQNASTAYGITWPASVIWAGGYAPTMSTLSSSHIFNFYAYDSTSLMGSHVSSDNLSTLSSTGGTTLSNAIAIFDSTTGVAITDGTTCLDISGNFTNVLTINTTNWSTLVSDVATNNSKVTNADHTGDVTGSLGLTIVPSAISGKTAVTPVAGDYLLLWDATDSLIKKTDATNFISAVTASSTTTFTNKRITKRVQTITDGTGIIFDSDSYDIGKVTLAGNRTLNKFTGTPTDGQTAELLFIQDATGSRTITLTDTTGSGSFRLGTDITGITLSTTAGKKDLMMLQYFNDSTAWLIIGFIKGY